MLIFVQIQKGLSVSSWPSGHTIDSEEAIEFTELENIDCMIEKYPLEKCNDAYSQYLEQDMFNIADFESQMR